MGVNPLKYHSHHACYLMFMMPEMVTAWTSCS